MMTSRPRLEVFLFGVAVVCLSIADSARGSNESVLDTAIEAQFLSAEAAWDLRGHLIIDGSTDSSAKPDGTVRIGREFIRQIRDGLTQEQKDLVVAFIVSHEVWHLAQFRLYGRDVVEASTDMRRVYECQADIHAWLSVAYGFPEISSTASIEAIGRKGKDIMTVAKRFGSRVDDFPGGRKLYMDANRRIMAAQMSLWRAAAASVDRLASIAAAQSILDGLNVLRNRIARQANLQKGVTESDWSLDHCKRLTRFKDDVIPYVEMDILDDSYLYEPSYDGEFGEFALKLRLPYRNKGKRPIRISQGILLGYVPESEVADFGKYVFEDGFYREIDIPPGEVRSFEGILRGSAIEKGYIPKIIWWSGDKNSLFSANYSGPRPQGSTCASVDANSIESSIGPFALALFRIANSARDDFESLVDRTIYANASSSMSTLTISIPGAAEARLFRTKQSPPIVMMEVYKGGDKDAALKSYSAFATQIRAICGGGGVEVEMTERPLEAGDLPFILIEEFSRTSELFMSTSFDEERNLYLVTVALRKKL